MSTNTQQKEYIKILKKRLSEANTQYENYYRKCLQQEFLIQDLRNDLELLKGKDNTARAIEVFSKKKSFQPDSFIGGILIGILIAIAFSTFLL